jgi:hypothetical protein
LRRGIKMAFPSKGEIYAGRIKEIIIELEKVKETILNPVVKESIEKQIKHLTVIAHQLEEELRFRL